MSAPTLRSRDFSSLAVKDLLEARDAYHVHLAALENVVGTAIGRYRVRASEADSEEVGGERSSQPGEPKTLGNTVVTKWSWPCVLVFVDRWLPLDAFARRPDQVVPPRLYLPDGRVVPTCVVLAQLDERAAPPLQKLTFPPGLMGGGYPALTRVQGQTHVGSFGCLVTDGDAVYALTNRHVTGTDVEEAREVFTLLNGERRRVGVAHRTHVGKLPFSEVYPGWPGTHCFANLDAGLVRLDDVRGWSAQVYGVGELDELIDLNTHTINLALIGFPVRAFGGASGALEGEVSGLFYRYKTVGGFDYVADLLVGPREGHRALTTRPGDSGTVWFFDPPDTGAAGRSTGPRRGPRAPRLRPLAVQWGGKSLLEPGGQGTQFALATCLSTICRELDLEVVRDWSIGFSEYWGKVGHYKVGAKACELLSDAKLSLLMLANQDRIAIDDVGIASGNLPMNNSPSFVPLADVADLVWRTTRKKDAANHFADMDEPGKGRFRGKTLLELWMQDAASHSPEVWTEFYDALGVEEDKHRGALPFRVWEMYEAMVGFAREGEVEKFVCTAGLLAHYVGDACQPLHVSFLHHGRPGHADEKNVHSVYETKMLDRNASELIEAINESLEGQATSPGLRVTGGHEAADAVVQLMSNTLHTLPPMDVIDAFNAESGRARLEHMWEALGERTVQCMSAGALRLASLWESAWKEGAGDSIPQRRLGPVDTDVLKELYMDRSFLEVRWLKDMELTLPAPRPQRVAGGTRRRTRGGRATNHAAARRPNRR
ncbi:MAG: hypothetical protein L0Y64_10380 [Myxococcaceae bacterium]|nr:hypothetical protein [Myxococcaceae bacterium]